MIVSGVNQEGNLCEEALLIDQLDTLIQTFNPASYALIVDSSKEDQQVNIDKVFDKIETFVEVIYENMGALSKMETLPTLPKSLMEDATGITRVVLLLESTTWKQMTFKE